MPDIKPITAAGIPAALQKAERYRLLNDSPAAESICLDILSVDADNQSALVTLLLSITDQFGEDLAEGARRALALLPRLKDEYKRAYYTGIILERRAKAQLHRALPGAADIAVDYFQQALHFYAKAESIRPAGNDEAILRWNTCVRMLAKHERAGGKHEYEPALDD